MLYKILETCRNTKVIQQPQNLGLLMLKCFSLANTTIHALAELCIDSNKQIM